MTTQIVEGLELFSEAQLEALEFLPEELENIESELYPSLESISLEEVAKDLEAFFIEGSRQKRERFQTRKEQRKERRANGQKVKSYRSRTGQQSQNARAGRDQNRIPPEATDRSPIAKNREILHVAYSDRGCGNQLNGQRRSIHNSFNGDARSVRVFYEHPWKGLRRGPCRKISE